MPRALRHRWKNYRKVDTMKKIQSIIIVLIVAALMLTSLAACSDKQNGGDDTTAAGTSTDTAAVVEETTKLLSIPDDVNLGGETMGVLYWSDVENPEFFAEEGSESTDKTLDAIKRRNASLEDRMQVKLDFIPQAGNFTNLKNFVSYIDSSYKTGDHAFDIIAGYSQSVANAAFNNYCYDLAKTEYLDFDKPWWPSRLTKEATVNNRLYFVSGDISTNLLYSMYTVFFNKDLMATHPDLKSPYDLVNSNGWTVDTMLTMCQGFYRDLDADGKKSNGDQFGLILPRLGLDTFFYGSGLRTTDKNADGTLIVSDTYFSEKAQNLLEKLEKVCYDDDDGYWKGKPDVFVAGNAAFYCDRAVRAMWNLGDVDFQYGVVPAPKWDSTQEDYYTCVGNAFTLYAIMGNSDRPDLASAVLECWAYEAYEITTPVVFEITMKIRFAKDSETAKLYDMIRDGVTFDLGRIYGATMNKLTQSIYRDAMENRSAWTKLKVAYSSQMENYLKDINASYTK